MEQAQPEESDPALPGQLSSCPREVLEAYVVARICRYIRARARRLGLSADLATALLPAAAAAEATAGGAGAGAGASEAVRAGSLGSSSGDGALVFFHDCQHLGCADPACALCVNNPQRKCSSCFMSKYFQGAPLVAGCGAQLCVAVCGGADGAPLEGVPPDLQLEIFLLNNRLYEGHLQYNGSGGGTTGGGSGAGSGGTGEDQLQASMLLKNAKGTNLLLCSAASAAQQQPSGTVRAPLAVAALPLPELRVDGSSEGLLGSKLWGYRLAVRVVDASGAPVRAFQPAVSDQFIVTTTRVRGNVKPLVPLTTDPVSKLNGIGAKMAEKLARAGELLAGLDVPVPPGGIKTVADYQALVHSADHQPRLCERVIAALGLQKGWEEARRHALSAVQPDSRARVWFGDPALNAGIVFRGNQGCPLLDHPAGSCESTGDGGLLVVSALPAAAGAAGRAQQAWCQQARVCWSLPGHPGWGVLEQASDGLEALLLQTNAAVLPAPGVQPCRQAVLVRLAALPPFEVLLPQAVAALGAAGLDVSAAARSVGIPTAGQPLQADAGAAAPLPDASAGVPEAAAAAPAGPAEEPAWQVQPEAEGQVQGPVPAQRQEPPPSPYETAMRLPSLPLLSPGDMFPSLPKEVQAMNSLSQLLFCNDSLLPRLSQLAEHKAAAMRGSGGSGGSGGEQAPAQPNMPAQREPAQQLPSLVELLLMDIDPKFHRAAAEAGEPGTPAQPGGASGGPGGSSLGGGMSLRWLERPSWIPSGLLEQTLAPEGRQRVAAMDVSRQPSREQEQQPESKRRSTAEVGRERGGSAGERRGDRSQADPVAPLLASMSLDG